MLNNFNSLKQSLRNRDNPLSCMSDALELWINSGCQNHKFYEHNDAMELAAHELCVRGGASMVLCFRPEPS